jgi:hypothetical protein
MSRENDTRKEVPLPLPDAANDPLIMLTKNSSNYRCLRRLHRGVGVIGMRGSPMITAGLVAT